MPLAKEASVHCIELIGSAQPLIKLVSTTVAIHLGS